MKYQFQVDNRVVAPVRETYERAVKDAVSAGYAIIVGEKVYLEATQGAEIKRI
jgi:hypothetical protein